MSRRDHWDTVYREQYATQVSWYQAHPDVSLDFIAGAGSGPGPRILDVGAGASALVDHLLDAGHEKLGALDISAKALELTKRRLGDRSRFVEWFVTDVADFESPHRWDVWHDRAVLHFLTEPEQRDRYRQRLEACLEEGGAIVLGTFGPNGPTRCSGLDVRRYGAGDMQDWLGRGFALERQERVEHRTPGGGLQEFQFCLFRRTAGRS